jgi:hypothetical protein
MKTNEPQYIAVLVPPSKKLSSAKYISTTDNILEKLKVHPLMQHEIRPPNHTLEALTQKNEEHRGYFQAGLNGDRVYKFKRDISRQESQNMYSDTAIYLTALAGGDPVKLQDTGYEMRFTGAHRVQAYNPLLVPYNPQVKHAGEEGGFVISCGRAPGVGSVEVMMTLDPSDERNWQECLKSSKFTNLLVRGLTPGQKYYFRIRYIGPTGAGPWCEPIGLICL